MYKLAILSDTHGLLRPEIIEKLHGCAAILHGGDINKQSILDELNKIAPVYVVRGNNDKEWAENIPETLDFTLYGVRFFMVHNKKKIPKDTAGIDIIIYGHSHKYEEKYKNDQLFINPGSCGPRRFTQPVTMAMLEINEDYSFHIEKIEIPRQISSTDSEPAPEETKLPPNIKRIINAIIKDTNRGRSVKEMAASYGISEQLTEQICRLYLTHPGVDADGIMGKMGL